jgi:hypothetical protein
MISGHLPSSWHRQLRIPDALGIGRFGIKIGKAYDAALPIHPMGS